MDSVFRKKVEDELQRLMVREKGILSSSCLDKILVSFDWDLNVPFLFHHPQVQSRKTSVESTCISECC